MTPEQQFDRLERIVKLMIRAGLRARTESRRQDEKITILINAQIRNEDRFARTDERFAKTDRSIAKTEELIARLAQSQDRTDQKLQALIDIVRNGRTGPPTN
jgi:hypothetical protein